MLKAKVISGPTTDFPSGVTPARGTLVTTHGIALLRFASGYYTTPDGAWVIERGPAGCGWTGEWIFKEQHVHGACSDPVPTMREACRGLRATLEAR